MGWPDQAIPYILPRGGNGPIPHSLRFPPGFRGEQQDKTYEEIMDQWYWSDYWLSIRKQVDQIDSLIKEFNDRMELI